MAIVRKKVPRSEVERWLEPVEVRQEVLFAQASSAVPNASLKQVDVFVAAVMHLVFIREARVGIWRGEYVITYRQGRKATVLTGGGVR